MSCLTDLPQKSVYACNLHFHRKIFGYFALHDTDAGITPSWVILILFGVQLLTKLNFMDYFLIDLKAINLTDIKDLTHVHSVFYYLWIIMFFIDLSMIMFNIEKKDKIKFAFSKKFFFEVVFVNRTI